MRIIYVEKNEMERNMKKAARIIIPIVLALIILLGTVWYLFIYDKDFTRDIFLHAARFFQSRGNYEIAAWCYDSAYKQSDDNDAVAIELSRQHANAGNYLQAEKAIVSAIEDSPSAVLYVALSNLYLEQNKVLDAVDLMDDLCGKNSTISLDIRNELISMRPAAPKAVPIPNAEDNTLYASVEFSAATGTLYINKAGTYPSFDNPAHRFSSGKKNVLLDEGMNNIYAVAISDDGIVSPLTIYEYELNSNHRRLTEATFTDSAMETALRNALNLDAETVIMTNQLWEIKEFTVPNGVNRLDDLYHLIGLEKLTIKSAPADQLSYLEDMEDLIDLTISETPLSQEDLSMIGSLPNLERLTLQKCGLTTLNGIENATKLTYLDLSGNAVVNITPVTSLTNITELYLNENSLQSLSGISGLSRLSVLNVSNNVIASVSDLVGCTSLRELNISSNNLSSLDEITQLHSLAKLNFSNNSVTSLPDWDKTCGLITIDGSYNNITSLEPLAGLENLNNVFMDYNQNLESVTCLKDCYRLIQVNVYGTKVRDVRVLTDMSVIVKYDPT